MKCEHCGYDAPERAVICPECGEILPRPKKAEEEETEKAAVQKKQKKQEEANFDSEGVSLYRG